MAKPSQSRTTRPSGPRAALPPAKPVRKAPISATAASWAKPAPLAPGTPDPTAVALFERAMGAVQQHHYQPAATLFRELLTSFPSERMLLERARVYLELCERELRRRQPPLTAQERLTAATAALNNERDDEAERLAHSVLDELPDHDLALYLLAAVHARRGEAETALEWLTRAMDVSPDVRAQARHDTDFQSLRELDAFQQLLDSPISARSDAQRNRRPR